MQTLTSIPPKCDSLLRELDEVAEHLEWEHPMTARRIGQLGDDIRAELSDGRLMEVVR